MGLGFHGPSKALLRGCFFFYVFGAFGFSFRSARGLGERVGLGFRAVSGWGGGGLRTSRFLLRWEGFCNANIRRFLHVLRAELWILGFGVYYAGTISLRRYD